MDGKQYLRDLQVTLEPPQELRKYKNNSKVHTAEQIKDVVESIKEFGFNDPVAVWTNKDGEPEIVEGHGRVAAALMLGMAKIPVIHLDCLTDEQRRAYTHVHNQLTLATGFIDEQLREEVSELGELLSGFDFDFGFSAEDEAEEQVRQAAPVVPMQTSEGANDSDRFDFLFVCHTQDDMDWMLNMVGGAALEKTYEAEEVINAQV